MTTVEPTDRVTVADPFVMVDELEEEVTVLLPYEPSTYIRIELVSLEPPATPKAL